MKKHINSLADKVKSDINESNCRKNHSEKSDRNENVSHEMCGSSLLFNNLIWTIEEVCSFTAYKKGTIYNLVSDGSIPYRKRGKRLFFIPSEILLWIKGEFK